MRRWLTILVFVLALGVVPALAQGNSGGAQQQQQTQPAQSTQSGSSKQTTTSTSTQKTTTPTQVERTGIDPLYLAIGGIALITIIAIALLAARSRGRDKVATVRETTVIKE